MHVETSSEDCAVKVYNLTLDRDNVYYANGVLVANCGDALALTFAEPVSPGQRFQGAAMTQGRAPATRAGY